MRNSQKQTRTERLNNNNLNRKRKLADFSETHEHLKADKEPAFDTSANQQKRRKIAQDSDDFYRKSNQRATTAVK